MVDESSLFMSVSSKLLMQIEVKRTSLILLYSTDEEDPDLSPPDLDKSLSVTARLAVIRQVLERKDSFTVIAMDAKACYGALERSCGICCQGKFQDPKVATWLLDPGAKEKNLHRMVHDYLPLEAFLLEGYLLLLSIFICIRGYFIMNSCKML